MLIVKALPPSISLGLLDLAGKPSIARIPIMKQHPSFTDVN